MRRLDMVSKRQCYIPWISCFLSQMLQSPPRISTTKYKYQTIPNIHQFITLKYKGKLSTLHHAVVSLNHIRHIEPEKQKRSSHMPITTERWQFKPFEKSHLFLERPAVHLSKIALGTITQVATYSELVTVRILLGKSRCCF